jgi:hypothetical protein
LDRRSKFIASLSFLIVLSIFISFAAVQLARESEKIHMLSDSELMKSKVAERFPDFPVISLDGVINTALQLMTPVSPNRAQIVVLTSGKQPEYFRWFMVYERTPDPVQYDPTNHFHQGFITSDLEIYDVGLDVLLQ